MGITNRPRPGCNAYERERESINLDYYLCRWVKESISVFDGVIKSSVDIQ